MFLYEPAIVSTVERSTFAEQRSGVQGAATALSVTYGIVRTPLPPLRHSARLRLLTGLMQQQSIPIVLKDYGSKPRVPLRPPETSMGTGGFCVDPSLGYSHRCLFVVVQVEYFKSVDGNVKWV